MVYQLTYHDDATMQKVYRALLQLPLGQAMTTEVVMALENAGILFREPAQDKTITFGGQQKEVSDSPLKFTMLSGPADSALTARCGVCGESIAVGNDLVQHAESHGTDRYVVDTATMIGISSKAMAQFWNREEEAMARPETFQDKARRIVIEYFNQHRDVTDSQELRYPDTYVVWFSKTLLNWKALVSTVVSDGMYYELTYNGTKRITYLDVYKKLENVAVPDSEDMNITDRL